jgi:hypothetical protein
VIIIIITLGGEIIIITALASRKERFRKSTSGQIERYERKLGGSGISERGRGADARRSPVAASAEKGEGSRREKRKSQGAQL